MLQVAGVTLVPEVVVVAGKRASENHVAWVVTLGAIVVGVSGCEGQNLNQGPAEISIRHGALLVAVCQEIEAKGILVNALGAGWEPMWEAAGLTTMLAGQVVDAGSLERVFAEVSRSSEPEDAATGLEVIVYGADEKTNITASFDLTKLDSAAVSWLRPDGTLSSAPCR